MLQWRREFRPDMTEFSMQPAERGGYPFFIVQPVQKYRRRCRMVNNELKKESAAAGKKIDTSVHEDGSVTVDDGCCKMKKRSPKEYRDLVNRLSRIEGQIRGIRRMVEEDAYCPDILRQSSAAAAALNSFNKVLLASHIRTCVADDIRMGKDESIDELVNMLQKMMK